MVIFFSDDKKKKREKKKNQITLHKPTEGHEKIT